MSRLRRGAAALENFFAVKAKTRPAAFAEGKPTDLPPKEICSTPTCNRRNLKIKTWIGRKASTH